jgi:hypothetical protein
MLLKMRFQKHHFLDHGNKNTAVFSACHAAVHDIKQDHFELELIALVSALKNPFKAD